MSKSLAELRTSPRVGLPERTYSLCLASSLVGEIQSLIAELQDAEVLVAAQAEGDGDKAPPRRAGQKSPADKIRKRLAELQSEMIEHTGQLGLRGIKNAAWMEWVAENPAREGNQRDQAYAYGVCDADALMADLGRYAATWSGDPMAPADWEFIEGAAAPADIKGICQLVVAMHEMRLDIPKLLSGLLGTPEGEST
ncbi:MAG: hypothetical protein M3N43_05860 [Actinomycetota bacterium]|nr:hypothetical protein [Actinomycetota bacterium]